MTNSSTSLKYPSAVLAETPATYILMYCNASSTAFTAVCCFQFKEWYWFCKLPCIRPQVELSSAFVYDCEMSMGGISARNSYLGRWGGGGGWGSNDSGVLKYTRLILYFLCLRGRGDERKMRTNLG